jgi:hypothetical protein
MANLFAWISRGDASREEVLVESALIQTSIQKT